MPFPLAKLKNIWYNEMNIYMNPAERGEGGRRVAVCGPH